MFEVIVKLMKVHVQITRFTCCLNMGFHLTILKISPDTIQGKALLPGPIITATFLFAKMLLAL